MKEKKNTMMELVFILDKSGSMGGLEKDTIGGFNSILRKQRKGMGAVKVTTVLFDDRYSLLHDRFDIGDIKPITGDDYFVEGCTALLDAMGKTITKIKNVQKNSSSGSRADNVLFVIITDGMENASREYDSCTVKKMVDKQKSKGWEFLFLGANIDAAKTAGSFGISADRAADYVPDGRGTKLNYEAVGAAVEAVRCSKKLTSGWKEKIDEDFSKRA